MARDQFYKQLDKIILAAIVGSGALFGVRMGTDRLTDEVAKLREVVAVVATKIEDHDRRISNLEELFLKPSR